MSRSVQIRAGQILDEDDERKGSVTRASQNVYRNTGAQRLLTVARSMVRQWRELMMLSVRTS